MSATHILLPREKEVKFLINHIEAGNCAFIFGLPFIGKTILAHNIVDRLKTKDGVFVFYLDLKEFQGNTTDDLINSIILKIGKKMPGGSTRPLPGKGNREYHLKKLLQNLPNEKIVILLDSAECIKKLSDWNIFLPIIRGFHEELGVVFLLFSRIRPQGFAENPICSSAINIFEANLTKLNLLPRNVVDLLSKNLASNGIEVETIFPDFVWQHTGGHPFLIKTFMDTYGAKKKKYTFLDNHDFNDIKEEAEAKLQGFYKGLFAILSPHHHQIIANDVLKRKISKNRDKSLRDLLELGILRQSGEGYQLFSLGAQEYFQKNMRIGKNRRKNKSLLSFLPIISAFWRRKKTYGSNADSKGLLGDRQQFEPKKILILAANPKGTTRLRLDEAVREIEEGLRRAKHRDRFEIRSKWAVRLGDLRRALLDYEPHIVHFTGHGEENSDCLMVEDEMGFAVRISNRALSGLFKLFSKHVRCVILAACHSEPQAAAISKYIDYVIGMKKEIKDKAALEFSVGFYDALAAGRPVREAFEFGCNAIQFKFSDISEHLIPVFIERSRNYLGVENDKNFVADVKENSYVI